MSDHKAEAEDALTVASNVVRNFEGATPEVLEWLAEAQAHATLELAEQQRIANLIAYVQMLDAQFRDAGLGAAENWDMGSFESSEARRESAQSLIREGLGLS